MRKQDLNRLLKLCDKYEIDPQLIDDSLSYGEAYEELKQWFPLQVLQDMQEEELPSRQAKEQFEAYKSAMEWHSQLTYMERFGKLAEGEIPPIFNRVVVHFTARRRLVRYKNPKEGIFRKLLKLRTVVEHIKKLLPDPRILESLHTLPYQTEERIIRTKLRTYIKKRRPRWTGYLTLTGTTTDLTTAITILQQNGWLRTVGSSHVYDSRIQYAPQYGWITKPT